MQLGRNAERKHLQKNESLDILSGLFAMYGGKMNKVQRNAKAFEKLLEIEYVFYLAYKKEVRKVVLHFEKEDFCHLEGIGQLFDLPLHSMPARRNFSLALEGKINVEDLEKSVEYKKHMVARKVDHLYLLEEFIDNNDIVFNYIKHKTKGSNIQAKIFLYKDMSGQDIYLFLDSSNDDEYYYPRSFVVAPELDYKVGQYKYTVLWKEKRNRKTGESEVLTQFKDFLPEKISA